MPQYIGFVGLFMILVVFLAFAGCTESATQWEHRRESEERQRDSDLAAVSLEDRVRAREDRAYSLEGRVKTLEERVKALEAK